MLEQEKKQADLEISRKELEFHQQEKMIQQLEQRLSEERKRKRRATRKVCGIGGMWLFGNLSDKLLLGGLGEWWLLDALRGCAC